MTSTTRDTIDVFVWPGQATKDERAFTHEGFNVARFSRDGMNYWLVSGLNLNELTDLARLIAGQGRAP
jgi:hypothetical protein